MSGIVYKVFGEHSPAGEVLEQKFRPQASDERKISTWFVMDPFVRKRAEQLFNDGYESAVAQTVHNRRNPVVYYNPDGALGNEEDNPDISALEEMIEQSFGIRVTIINVIGEESEQASAQARSVQQASNNEHNTIKMAS